MPRTPIRISLSVVEEQGLPLERRLRRAILFARERVYHAGAPTPLDRLGLPDGDLQVWVKREDLGPIKAYKWRGAFNRMAIIAAEEPGAVAVTASAGNHAQGVALAARKLGMNARIYMPRTTPRVKIAAAEAHGDERVEIRLAGDSYDDADKAARTDAAKTGAINVHAYDDLDVMAGQGTLADEVVLSGHGPFDVALLQIGGGGMAAGVGCWLKTHWPDIDLIGGLPPQRFQSPMKSKAFSPVSPLIRRWLTASVLLMPLASRAADVDQSVSQPTGTGLIAVDWIIIAAYALSTLFLGWWFARKQKDTKEYFVGSGNMNPLLIGVSLFATLLSTISYLSFPGESLGKGPVYLTNILSYPVIFLIVGFGLLPVYMKLKVTSAYELLEKKLGISIRLLGACLFLTLRLFWMTLLVFLTSKAITIMIGVDEKYIPLFVIVTGAFAITYTSLGGLRAVVITDLMQTLLLYGGALLVIGTITVKMGGFGWFPTEWQSEIWDTQPIVSLDPSTRITVVGSILSVLIWHCCTAGGDQVTIQRFMATRDAGTARRAIGIQLLVGAIVAITLFLTGFALLGYFQANPDLLPAGMTLNENADSVFPHFIAFHLPPVVSGLVMAGLFAAAMSSIDSGVNSITAVVMTDFLDRFGLKPKSEKQHVLLARGLAVCIGVVVVLGSTIIEHVPGNISAVTNKTVNLLTVPIFLLFFFALFVPFSNTAGTWIGVSCSIITAALIAFSGPIFGMNEHGLDPVSFQWISPAALVVGISVGCLASKVFSDKQPDRG